MSQLLTTENGGGVPRLLRRLSAERALRWRRPPKIRTDPGAASRAVYYLCPDYPSPSGGIRAIYRHVDILNGAGLDASVLHHSDGYACNWFEHSTRTVGVPSASLSHDDLLVVPEIYAPFFRRLPRGPRLVAFNQNAYLTFEHVPSADPLSYELFDAVLTVSSDSAEYLRLAFPSVEVAVVEYSIDPALFKPSPRRPAKRIAVMPRKRPDEAAEIVRLLGDRLCGWEVLTIEGASEQETASLLRDSPIFLALGKREGFGLPAAEAMASGCYVVGFTGFGGREIFDPAFSSPVEDGDVVSAARELAEAVARYERRPDEIRECGARAAEHVRRRFSVAAQERSLVAFYEGLL